MAVNSQRQWGKRGEIVRAVLLRAGEGEATDWELSLCWEGQKPWELSCQQHSLTRLEARPHTFWGHKQGHDNEVERRMKV